MLVDLHWHTFESWVEVECINDAAGCEKCEVISESEMMLNRLNIIIIIIKPSDNQD